MHQRYNTMLLCAALIFFAWMIQIQFFLNCDVSWLAHATERLLAGGNYVNNFFETNPPLILYLFIPAILLKNYLALSFIFVVRAYIFFLSIALLALSAPLIKKLFADENERSARIFLFVLAIIYFVFPSVDFGQREHLTVVFITPYLLLVTARLMHKPIPKSYAMLVGASAAIGFCMKPFFFLPFCLIELYIRRWFSRPEIFAFVSTALLYLLSIVIFYPDYFTVIIPYSMRLYYLGNAESLFKVMQTPGMLYSVAALFLFFILSANKPGSCAFAQDAARHFNRVLTLTILGFILVHIMQRMTTLYHLMPAFCYAILLFAFNLSLTITTDKKTSRYYGIIAMIVGINFIYLLKYLPFLWTIIVFDPTIFYSYLFLLSFCFYYLTWTKRHAFWALMQTIVTILVVMISSYYLQFTEFYSHRFAYTIFLLFLILILFTSRKTTARLHGGLHAMMLFLIFLHPFYFVYLRYQSGIRFASIPTALIEFMQQNPQYQSIYMISDTHALTFPMVDYAHVRYVSRMPFFWMAAGLLKQARMNQSKGDDRNYLIHLVNEDFRLNLPDVIFVDANPTKFKWNERHYDYLTDFSKDKTFQQYLSQYQYVRTFDFVLSVNSDITYKLAMYARKGI